jgi:hypothetical protein
MLRHTYIACRAKTAIHEWNKKEKNTYFEFTLVNSHMSTPCNATFIYIKLSLSKPWRHIGTAEVQLHSFVTSALEGGVCSTSRPGRCTSGREYCYPANRRVGGSQDRSGEANNLRVMKTNLMHCLSSVYFVNQLLHVSGVFVAHHEEVYCIYTAIGTCCADKRVV